MLYFYLLTNKMGEKTKSVRIFLIVFPAHKTPQIAKNQEGTCEIDLIVDFNTEN